MTLDELLEQFDEVLDSGIKIPGKKTVVDIEKLRAVVDDIRLNIPAEIKQAKGIVADRADIITNAKQRNHFMKLKLYTRMSLNPTMIKKKGIRNAGNPKFSVMKK